MKDDIIRTLNGAARLAQREAVRLGHDSREGQRQLGFAAGIDRVIDMVKAATLEVRDSYGSADEWEFARGLGGDKVIVTYADGTMGAEVDDPFLMPPEGKGWHLIDPAANVWRRRKEKAE